MMKALFAALALVTLLASPTFAQTANSPTCGGYGRGPSSPCLGSNPLPGWCGGGVLATHTLFPRNCAARVVGPGFFCLARGAYSFAPVGSSISNSAVRPSP